jgi:proteasome lid subunit RPN8/RPN11
VEQAYQFQTSKRSRYSVTVPREESRCKEMIYKLSMFEPLGYFHSHPESEPAPTKEDIKSMKVMRARIAMAIMAYLIKNYPFPYFVVPHLIAIAFTTLIAFKKMTPMRARILGVTF